MKIGVGPLWIEVKQPFKRLRERRQAKRDAKRGLTSELIAEPEEGGGSDMNESILGVIRHVLTTAGGGLVAVGVVDETALQAIVGGIVALIGVAWSLWSKRQAAA